MPQRLAKHSNLIARRRRQCSKPFSPSRSFEGNRCKRFPAPAGLGNLRGSTLTSFAPSLFFHTYFATGDGIRRFVGQFDRTANPNGVSVEYGSSWWLDGDYSDINAAMRDVATKFAPAIRRFAEDEQRRSDLGMAQTLAAKHSMTVVGDVSASDASPDRRS